jgi:hypothetical protein
MLEIERLNFLIAQRLLDSEILLKNHRTNSCVYLAGYAIELALKLKISMMFDLKDGFPESKSEFSHYLKDDRSFRKLKGVITEIGQIKNHDLNKLLFYSGCEVRIKENKWEMWSIVSLWDPSLRYKSVIKGEDEAKRFLKFTLEIIDHILKK